MQLPPALSWLGGALLGLGLVACAPMVSVNAEVPGRATLATPAPNEVKLAPTGYRAQGETEFATLAGGCFWCVEEKMRATEGVVATAVGYSGGTVERPTYMMVSSKTTGHAEVVRVEFDPAVLSYEQLVTLFLTKWHDPTQVNRQGPDIGPQYRSAIFCHDDAQFATAQRLVKELAGEFTEPIATEVTLAGVFWMAEDYHQQYREKGG